MKYEKIKSDYEDKIEYINDNKIVIIQAKKQELLLSINKLSDIIPQNGNISQKMNLTNILEKIKLDNGEEFINNEIYYLQQVINGS